MNTLDQHLSAVLGAAATFDEQKGALFLPDGTKQYSDPVHEAKEQALLEQANRTFNDAHTSAQCEIDWATKELVRLQYDDPFDRLSADEQARANSKATFVREDCARLPLTELTQRLQAVAARQNRAEHYLWARYGRQAAQKAFEAVQTDRLDTAAGRQQARALRALNEALDALDQQLANPEIEQKRSEAQATLDKARLLQRQVAAQRAKVDGSDARARAEQAAWSHRMF
jgi:hypothetical protein